MGALFTCLGALGLGQHRATARHSTPTTKRAWHRVRFRFRCKFQAHKQNNLIILSPIDNDNNGPTWPRGLGGGRGPGGWRHSGGQKYRVSCFVTWEFEVACILRLELNNTTAVLVYNVDGKTLTTSRSRRSKYCKSVVGTNRH